MDRRQNLSWWAPNHKDARNDGFVSPRVGILYEPTSWLSVFGNFSESFGPAFAYDSGQERLFKFDSATQYEGGMKAQFFDGKLIANAAYFDLQKPSALPTPMVRTYYQRCLFVAKVMGSNSTYKGKFIEV